MFKLIKRCGTLLQSSNTKLSKCRVRTYFVGAPMWNASDKLEPNIEAITNGDPQLEHKIKVIFLEAEVMRQDGKNVPSNEFMKDDYWRELLNLETRTARRRYLDHLFKIEKTKENDAVRKEQRRIKREQEYQEAPPIEGPLRYDLGHNNFMIRIYDSTINQLYNNNLMKAMQFGQKIVVDCGYTDHMTKRENINCAKQLTFLFSENRAHKDPYDVHYCNADPNSTLMHYFHKHVPTMYEDWFPINLHADSYLNHFKKEELVYLTPHCRDVITEYDHDAVYIIGGIVDKMNNEPVSLAKAKKEGLRMAKLPLDKYLSWSAGSGKCLTLNHMISILLDAKVTGDWDYAFRHVPRRKLVNENFPKFEDKRDTFRKRNFSSERTDKPDKNQERIIKMRSILYD